MNELTIGISVLALIYGILVIITALNMGEKMAGKACGKSAVQANNGLIVMGGMMIAFSLSYLTCQRKCGGTPTKMMNVGLYSLFIMAVAIICISLAAVAQRSAGCVDLKVPAQAIWVTGILVLLLGIVMGSSQLKIFNKAMVGASVAVPSF